MCRDLTLNRLGVLFLMLLATLLQGCSNQSGMTTTQSISPKESAGRGFANWSDTVADYRYQPGDKLRVQFLLTNELNEDVLVSPDGKITLRVAGQVVAADRTHTELEAEINTALRGKVLRPMVTISLLESTGSKIFVGGSVLKPGAYPQEGRRGAFEAILLAGGLSPDARMSEVILIRRNSQSQPMLRTIDIQNFVNNGFDVNDVPLIAGDIVFVPRNKISEVDLWIDQFINRFVPFQRGFNYTINRNAPTSSF
jgi:protein involved in polysaccharide export with SLBB domain